MRWLTAPFRAVGRGVDAVLRGLFARLGVLDGSNSEGRTEFHKFLALLVVVVDLFSIAVRSVMTPRQGPNAADSVILIAALSAAFGPKIFNRFLSRNRTSASVTSEINAQIEQHTSTSHETRDVNITQRVVQEIIDRRQQGAEDVTEPTD